MYLPSSHKILETPIPMYCSVSILPLEIRIIDNYNFKFKVKKTRVCNYGINLKKNLSLFSFQMLNFNFFK